MKNLKLIAAILGSLFLLILISSVIKSCQNHNADSQEKKQAVDSKAKELDPSGKTAELLESQIDSILKKKNVIAPKTAVVQLEDLRYEFLCVKDTTKYDEIFMVMYKHEGHFTDSRSLASYGILVVINNTVVAYDQGAQEMFPYQKRQLVPIRLDKSDCYRWFNDRSAKIPPASLTGCW
jgi:hypothetical protein